MCAFLALGVSIGFRSSSTLCVAFVIIPYGRMT